MGEQLGDQIVNYAHNWVNKLHYMGACPAPELGNLRIQLCA